MKVYLLECPELALTQPFASLSKAVLFLKEWYWSVGKFDYDEEFSTYNFLITVSEAGLLRDKEATITEWDV